MSWGFVGFEHSDGEYGGVTSTGSLQVVWRRGKVLSFSVFVFFFRDGNLSGDACLGFYDSFSYFMYRL